VLADIDLTTPYGTVHHITDPHPLGRGGAALRSVFCPPPTPVGGSRHSVCLMAPNRDGAVIEGAPWRVVAELTPTATHVWDSLRHGSSGHPLSPHYDDQTAAHTEGRMRRTVLE
jgi:penicillin amidase